MNTLNDYITQTREHGLSGLSLKGKAQAVFSFLDLFDKTEPTDQHAERYLLLATIWRN